MNDHLNQTFYTQARYYVWKGFRLLGVDGSRLLLPNHKTIVEKCGVHEFGPNAGSRRSMALISLMYDVLNLVTIDAQMAPYTSSERELLYKHLDKAGKNDLLLMDRGYPSIALMFLLIAKGIAFCIRMKDDWWLSVKEFKESGEKVRIFSFKLPKKDRYLLEEYPYEDFKELYHYRWKEEEGYKVFKARAEIECFTGKTALAVEQDFYARIFAMSYCAIFWPSQKKKK